MSEKLSDEQLREELALGMRPRQIAEKYGLKPGAVYSRLGRQSFRTMVHATYAGPESGRYVHQQLNVLEELCASLQRVNMLYDACDEWLRDPDDPERYDLNPRAEEIDVIYSVDVPTRIGARRVTRKRKLSELLAKAQDEDGLPFTAPPTVQTKQADPRKLILQTAAEVRGTVGQAAEIARLLADARAMQALREAIIAEVSKVDPETGKRVVEAVRRSILLNATLGGPGRLPPPGPSAESLPGELLPLPDRVRVDGGRSSGGAGAEVADRGWQGREELG